jgi:hypothetical protein
MKKEYQTSMIGNAPLDTSVQEGQVIHTSACLEHTNRRKEVQKKKIAYLARLVPTVPQAQVKQLNVNLV